MNLGKFLDNTWLDRQTDKQLEMKEVIRNQAPYLVGTYKPLPYKRGGILTEHAYKNALWILYSPPEGLLRPNSCTSTPRGGWLRCQR